jgi:hypothetical protein
MSAAKHTPGPWAYRSMAGYCTQIDGADGHTICCFDEDPGDADAKLITAAPELLEALQEAVACGMVPTSTANDGGPNRHSRQVRCADLIRAAIAKATGGTP